MLFPHYCDCLSKDKYSNVLTLKGQNSRNCLANQWTMISYSTLVRSFTDVISVPFGDNKSFFSLPNSFYNPIWRSPRSSAHGIVDFARRSRRGRAVRLDSRTWNTYENSERAGNPWGQKLWRMQRFPRNTYSRTGAEALFSFLLNPCRKCFRHID